MPDRLRRWPGSPGGHGCRLDASAVSERPGMDSASHLRPARLARALVERASETHPRHTGVASCSFPRTSGSPGPRRDEQLENATTSRPFSHLTSHRRGTRSRTRATVVEGNACQSPDKSDDDLRQPSWIRVQYRRGIPRGVAQAPHQLARGQRLAAARIGLRIERPKLPQTIEFSTRTCQAIG